MSEIRLVNVRNQLLRSVDLFVEQGESFVIVGPSGAGKTTLLRVIAGLMPHRGKVFLDGKLMNGVPPYLRKIGYVSQELHLFPHLTLEGNLLIAMDRLPLKKTVKRERAQELMEMLRIQKLAGRDPAKLSGGEKQRAALARALASSPRVLLLDEPFSKLDFRTSLYLRQEFKKLQRQLQLTTILVTHDMTEARDMGNDMAVMQAGSLEHTTIFNDSLSKTEGLANCFLEQENILECSNIRHVGNGLVQVEWAGLQFFVPDEGQYFSHMSIPAGKIRIYGNPFGGSPINRFCGTIRSVVIRDGMVQLVVMVGKERLNVELGFEQWKTSGLKNGDGIHGRFRLQDLQIHPHPENNHLESSGIWLWM